MKRSAGICNFWFRNLGKPYQRLITDITYFEYSQFHGWPHTATVILCYLTGKKQNVYSYEI